MNFGMKVPASTSFLQLRRRARSSSFRPLSFAEITKRLSSELLQYPDARRLQSGSALFGRQQQRFNRYLPRRGLML
jgi:hypothetical protein